MKLQSILETKYGKDMLGKQPKGVKKNANAQDAHEAIRPTAPYVNPIA